MSSALPSDVPFIPCLKADKLGPLHSARLDQGSRAVHRTELPTLTGLGELEIHPGVVSLGGFLLFFGGFGRGDALGYSQANG